MHKYQWDKQELERLYNNENMTIRGIAKRYGCMDKTVSEALRRLGVPTRRPGDDKRCNAKYTVNSHYFDVIDSEAKAYLLGLIASDGHVSKAGVLMFSFQCADADIIAWILDELDSNHPVKYRHNETSRHVSIASTALCKRLNEIGISNSKSYDLSIGKVMESIPDNLHSHFVRGLFDGDGSICIYKYPYFKKHTYHFGFTGVRETCDFMNEYFGLETKMADEGNGIWTCVSSNHQKIIAAGHKLYRDATVFFPRKRDTFLQIEELCKIEHGFT